MSIKRIAKQEAKEGRSPSLTTSNTGGQQCLGDRGATARAQVSAWAMLSLLGWEKRKACKA
jgi:hypothetical protein